MKIILWEYLNQIHFINFYHNTVLPQREQREAHEDSAPGHQEAEALAREDVTKPDGGDGGHHEVDRVWELPPPDEAEHQGAGASEHSQEAQQEAGRGDQAVLSHRGAGLQPRDTEQVEEGAEARGQLRDEGRGQGHSHQREHEADQPHLGASGGQVAVTWQCNVS